MEPDTAHSVLVPVIRTHMCARASVPEADLQAPRVSPSPLPCTAAIKTGAHDQAHASELTRGRPRGGKGAYESVTAARGEQSPARVPVHTRTVTCMAVQVQVLLARVHVPDTHRVVIRRRSKLGVGRTPGQAEDTTVAVQLPALQAEPVRLKRWLPVSAFPPQCQCDTAAGRWNSSEECEKRVRSVEEHT